ncbi:MAG: methyltransferase domain-containing protein [Clostridia bacterium]|nr:methyltransferase domain-containing protein [Clostridia bacterium]
MRLILDYYKENEDCGINEEEQKIIEYINTETVPESNSDTVMIGLSNLRENLIHSYEFNPNGTLLEIGAHLGEVTGALCKKNQKVIAVEENKRRAEAIAKRHSDKENLGIIVGKLQDITFKEKFDYITLIGILEQAQKYFDTHTPAVDLIIFCKQLLKPDGKLLIATNNKFALKSYIGDIDECTGITFDSITDYKSSKKTYKLGKNQIEKILNQVGFNYYKFLYPLPDYKLPSLIFSDEYLPSSSKINGYFPYYNKNSSIFYSEVDAYDAIIKENKEMFPFFANSYFIEASQEEFNNDTRYVSFNNYRKQEYQLMTKIKKTVVQKSSINDKSEKHIQNMIQNIQNLREQNFEILDREKDGKVESVFIKQKLASQIISDNVNHEETILKILNKYKETILRLSTPFNEQEKTVFDKYNIEIENEILAKFNYLKNGYWDMILKNCFIIDDKCMFFDQEWVENNVPAEFLIYRSIVNIEKLRGKIEEYNIYEKMGIKEFIPIFEELDRNITGQIIDKEVFSFYTRTYKNPIYENYKLQDENDNLKQENEQLSRQNGEVVEQIKQLTEKCEQLQNVKEELSTNIEEKNKKAIQLKEELQDIYQSKTWKFANSLAQIKRKLKK